MFNDEYDKYKEPGIKKIINLTHAEVRNHHWVNELLKRR